MNMSSAMLRVGKPLLVRSSRACALQKAPCFPSPQVAVGTTARLSSWPAPPTGRRAIRSGELASWGGRAWFASKTPSGIQVGSDPEEERHWREKKLGPLPVVPNEGRPPQDMKKGVKEELKIVKDTLALPTVPRESYILGAAGTLPYLATSVSTLYLSWVLNSPSPHTSELLNRFVLDHDSARYWLNVLEPIQLGYGAVIISFLGAIHWGLEYAEKTPNLQRTRFRYGLGLAASLVAWPTVVMPWQWALTTQWAAFVGLYYVDSRATARGWAPPWYGAYRFVLTAIVGSAIMLSLIGRARISGDAPRLSGLGDQFHETLGEEAYDEKWAKAETEDIKRAAEAKAMEQKKQDQKRKAGKKTAQDDIEQAKSEGGDEKSKLKKE